MELTQPLAARGDDFEALKVGLIGFNESHTGAKHRETVSVFLKDDNGKVVGGIVGEIAWDWMLIQGLWVSENIRSEGWGGKLLTEIEKYSTSKNITNIRLETTTFQALGFYVKAGYSIFGELENMPVGYTCYFLQKHLLSIS